MNRFERVIRIATPLALTFALGVAYTTVGPNALRGQAQEDCIEDEELGPCVDLQHVFMGDCEGSACYSGLELCCLPEFIIVIE